MTEVLLKEEGGFGPVRILAVMFMQREFSGLWQVQRVVQPALAPQLRTRILVVVGPVTIEKGMFLRLTLIDKLSGIFFRPMQWIPPNQ